MNLVRSSVSFALALVLALPLSAQKPQNGVPFKLYEGEIPNSIDVPDEEFLDQNKNPRAVSRPTLTAYYPEVVKSRGAVVVCPGGGYVEEWTRHEGEYIAKDLNRHGVVAFVLKYRLPNDKWCIDKATAPVQDAQKAVQYAREHARDFGYDADKIGIMGFSAGGYLAGSAVIFGGKDYIDNPAGLKLRPDFAMLFYPKVIIEPDGSFSIRFVGEGKPQEEYDKYSLEKNVDENTSPIILLHASDDSLVDVEESIALYHSLKAKGHSPSMHIYSKGNHGLGDGRKTDAVARCVYWMDQMGFGRQ